MTDLKLREAPLVFTGDLKSDQQARDQDSLNLLPYAEALADLINQCETPISIGVQGEPGIGRTSIMNMIRGHEKGAGSGLLDHERCRVISLDCWPYAQFHQGNRMAVVCLYAITQDLGRLLENEPGIDSGILADYLDAARQCLISVMKLTAETAREGGVQAEYELAFVEVTRQMLRFKTAFRNLLSLWTQADAARRLVIFVDDLDRVQPLMALEFLETIKNFIDIEACVFVLALDYDVIQRGLADKLGRTLQKTRGKALFDKLIQLPFVVPSSACQLGDYITDLLEKAGLLHVTDAAEDDSQRQFFLDITRYTVGRNPRSIKRIVNYTSLLERIHRHNARRATSPRECKILYALVSMQVAWPELFQYFSRDPSVDSVTSLQSWDFLETLPEAASLFERTTDLDGVKNAVSAFLDTLFSLLDDNDDGQVDSKELRPVIEVMEQARMTRVESHERPRDWIIRRVYENNVESSPLIESFVENVFKKSVWYLGTEIKYRRAGRRYVTLVHNRRQIGTIVSLRSQPFVFRLAMSPERVMNALKNDWDSKQSIKKEAIVLVRNTFGSEAALTGFGDTFVDFSKLTYMPSKEAVKLLNTLFEVVTEKPISNGKKKKKS
jgi:hypothetical protein